MVSGTTRLRAVVAGGVAVILASASIIATARAQTAPRASSGVAGANTTAAHDIIIRARVAPTCRITNTVPQIRLTGTTDGGQVIDATVSGSGGFIVDCNTPYAINLARSAIYAPAARRTTLAADKTNASGTKVASEGAGALQADAAEARALLDGARDMDVVMRVAGRDGPIESRCVMIGGDSPFVCHAVAGPEDARLPMPRASAAMIVTGALADARQGMNDDAAAPAPGSPPGAAAAAGAQAALVGLAKERASKVRVGDRLTVSLSAKF